MTVQMKEQKWFYSDENQIIKQGSTNDEFHMKEIVFLNEKLGYLLKEGIVYLPNYSKAEMLYHIEPYGYDSIEVIREEYKCDWRQIIAECIFENMSDFETDVYFANDVTEEYLDKIINDDK